MNEGLTLDLDTKAQLFVVASKNSTKTYQLTANLVDGAINVTCTCVKGAIDRNSKIPVSRCKHAAGLCRYLEEHGMIEFVPGDHAWIPAPAVQAAAAA